MIEIEKGQGPEKRREGMIGEIANTKSMISTREIMMITKGETDDSN